ncbi:MAG: response regulator [Bdellovibrionota bacterium]|nr:response regulator [Bdellovibrionota bacterium]
MASILIVDDEPAICRFIEFEAHELGHKVFNAYNGAEAKEILQKENIELVISDVLMPKLDGIELLKYVKNEHPEITTFLLISGFTSLTKAKALGLGATDILEKPIDFTRLHSYL